MEVFTKPGGIPTRQVQGFVGINGVNVWGDIRQYDASLEYTEVASGETDSFEIQVDDFDKHFISDWLVDKGTLLESKVRIDNNDFPGDTVYVDFGEFLVDRVKGSGPPLNMEIQSLALPMNGSLNTKKWENMSVSAIAQEICNYLGCELVYYADDIVVESKQQDKQKDVNFLFSLCKDYGFGMKVYRHKIIIFGREERDAEPAASDVDLELCSEYDFDDSEEGTYTGVKCTYKPEGTDEDATYTYGSEERLLVTSVSAKTEHEAELKAKAALYDANVDALTLKIKFAGGVFSIYAGQNYHVTNFGAYSGKYFCEKVVHTIDKTGYDVEAEFHNVELDKNMIPQISAADESGIYAGRRIELNDAPLYISSDATNRVRTVSGTYYLYDGENINGRYRICHENEIGKKPVGANVTGWIDGGSIT